MKAIFRVREFGPPEVLRIEEVPDPRPGPREQVVVRFHAAGVNPVETYIRSGTYSRKPDLPYTPGSDAAGVIASIGEGVHGVQPATAYTWPARSAARTPNWRSARATGLSVAGARQLSAGARPCSCPTRPRTARSSIVPMPGGGNRARSWGQARRGHRRRPDRPFGGHDRVRDGRYLNPCRALVPRTRGRPRPESPGSRAS